MPIYEYSCPQGHGRFQLRQGFDSKPVAACPTCNADSKRLFSTPAIVFKGNGWYATDSRGSYESEAGAPDSKSESAGSAEKDSSGEKDTAAAPAAPAAPAASTEP
ncbi:MAG: hypothetical protein EXR50_01695 [Dehalococcoidia bacterium]|nr:hypothetical protein [Dehalococcoidia bacterium]